MIAVISDVHGNLPALSAVLADIEAAGVRRIWCLGYTLGYGPFVNECMTLAAQRCEVVLAGNHDLAVRGDIATGLFGGTAGIGIQYASRVLGEEGRSLLAPLQPSRILEGHVELYHASANDPVWEYVRDEHVATSHLKVQRLPLSFIGHSHIQLAYHLAPEAAQATGGPVPADTRMELAALPGRLVVNPGSVGQPRDRDPRAAWALVEPNAITFRRVAYDIAAMRAAIEQAGLPSEVGERLELGW